MPKGTEVGKTVYESLLGFQWFLLINYLCWVLKEDKGIRRFTRATLFIPRKNTKTFMVALINLLLVLTSEKYAEFYSVAPDKDLSSIVKKQMEQIVMSSPALNKYFKYTKAKLICTINKAYFEPLANGQDRLDGREATGWIADEVGALKNPKPIEAMESSQVLLKNKTGMVISTAYDNSYTPMIGIVNYAKSVLDGTLTNERQFSLIYEMDNKNKWSDFKELLKVNPMAQELKNFREALYELRDKALMDVSNEPYFKTKHANIFLENKSSSPFIDIDFLTKGRIDEFDWRGKKVYVGLDLSKSDDNTAVSMVHYDSESKNFYVKSWSFYPANKTYNKTTKEKIPYNEFCELGYAYAIGEDIIDYTFIENFIETLQDNYGVNISDICYDQWNALALVQSLNQKGFRTIQIGQGVVLHPTIKFLREEIIKGNFYYEDNKLLELNFANAKLRLTGEGRMQVDKASSNFKIDILDSIINAFVPWHSEVVDDTDNYLPITIF